MTDLERLKQLEKETGRKLEKRDFEITRGSSACYVLDVHQNVTGLSLKRCVSGRLPKSLSSFHYLKKLRLTENKLTDLSGLEKLVNLTELNLHENQLSTLSGLEGLVNLTKLYLGQNHLNSLSGLEGLVNLNELYLHDNKLNSLSGIERLVNLTTLHLSRNQLTSLSGLERLKKLSRLALFVNKIKQLPEAIVDLGMEIDVESGSASTGDKGIFLSGNPIESPPMEILKKGNKAIKAYFKSLRDAEALPLNEVKVMLVGDGGAGKTSLVKRLMGQRFDKNESQTHGININQWKLTNKDRDITAHLWDFGGQQIMHATHQFFLSKRSLYILVLDGRKDEEPEYWLKHIQSFGGDSPVLVVINKIDQNPGFEVNRKFLMEKYKNIKGFFRLSCQTKEGIDAFSKALEKTLFQIEIIKTTWASNWFKVKERLEHMKEHYISFKEYKEICSGEAITEKEGRDTLVQFLNDLGVILHFKDLGLKDTHVLEPRWVTEAVYKIINSKALAEQSGVLKLDYLESILVQKTEADFDYPTDKYSFIIELMKKFELCYPLESGNEEVLIPDLLKKEEPPFPFDYGSALRFIFHYDFLPKSIMPRFIVRRHKDIKAGLQWRTGVVLKDTSTRSTAVVRADERERRVSIHVCGEGKRDFFSVIRKTFHYINASFEKLDTAELVPLPGYENETVTYKSLIGHMLEGKSEIFIGELRKSFSVTELLDGIEKKEDRENEHGMFKVPGGRGDVYVLQNVSQENKQVQAVKQDVKQDVNVSVDIDITVDLPALQADFEELKDLLIQLNPAGKGKLKELGADLDALTSKSEPAKLSGPLNRLGRFLKKVGDENSEYNKLLKGAKTGLEAFQKVGRTYNKFAHLLGLPSVPGILLGPSK